MEKVAFITGLNGQDGSYLAELLLEKDYFVYGIIRRMSLINTERIDHLFSHPKFKHFYGDVTDTSCMFQLLTKIYKLHPDASLEIYHLAAQSHVKISFELPEYTAEVDAIGTLRLLDVCKSLKETYELSKERLKIYIACTSEMYGKVIEIPQTEKTPFNPRSPYAISKQFAFYFGKNYREAYDMFISNGILFNHESPRRGFNFVTRKVTIGLGKILRGEISHLEMGNIDSIRDWGHAKDFVNAMYLMLQHDEPDDFVIATGETHTVREFIEKAFLIKGLQISWKGETGSLSEVGVDQNGIIRICMNGKYFRPTEVAYLQGDATKAKRLLGWEPECSFEQLITEMVDKDT